MPRFQIRSPRRGEGGVRRRIGRSRVPLHRRLLAARSAAAYWTAVALLALATGAVVAQLVGRAAAAERRWGATRPVLIAVRPLPQGRLVPRSAVRLEDRPVAFVPDGALARLPVGAQLAAPLARGEALTAARLVGRSAGPPAGQVAIAVPAGDTPLEVKPGQRVDVFATFDPSLAPSGTDATTRVAAGAAVVHSDRTAVTVTVDGSDAPAVVNAVARGTVILVLVGGS